jgi:hypothetical protein
MFNINKDTYGFNIMAIVHTENGFLILTEIKFIKYNGRQQIRI